MLNFNGNGSKQGITYSLMGGRGDISWSNDALQRQ